MSTGLLAFVAFVPILVVFVFMVGLRWPFTKAMPIAWIVAVSIAVIFWGMDWHWLFAANINGVLIALKVFLIVLLFRAFLEGTAGFGTPAAIL